jgi:hypothetical protein
MVTQRQRLDPLHEDEATLFPVKIPQKIMEDDESPGDQDDSKQDPGFFLTEKVNKDI